MSTFRNQITYSVDKSDPSIYFYLSCANLICGGTDVWKYFRESLGLKDNKSTTKCTYTEITTNVDSYIKMSLSYLFPFFRTVLIDLYKRSVQIDIFYASADRRHQLGILHFAMIYMRMSCLYPESNQCLCLHCHLRNRSD